MNSDSQSTKIEKLTEDNYHAWKQKVEHLLVLKDLEEFIVDDKSAIKNSADWKKKDRKACAIIGLTLSDRLLENVQNVKSANEMWTSIKDIFERHTLLNKLSARRKFYTASLQENESVLQFSNRIIHMSMTLKSMNVNLDDAEMAMALLNGLPTKFDALISALDAIGTEEKSLTFDFVKNRVLQEEQRISFRSQLDAQQSAAAALVANQSTNQSSNQSSTRPSCTYCKKQGHVEEKCWKKHPHLNPHKSKSTQAMMAQDSNPEESDDTVCLMTKYVPSVGPSSLEKNGDWFIDSGCSAHMTYDINSFKSYENINERSVELGNKETSIVQGKGDVMIHLKVNNSIRKCILKDVLHVPDLGYQLISVPMITKQNMNVKFFSQQCHILKGSNIVATGSMTGTLYKLDTVKPTSTRSNTALLAHINLWHERLAHINNDTIQSMRSNNSVTGLSIDTSKNSSNPCHGCIYGKAHRTIIPKSSSSRTSRTLELIHSDVSGPVETPSIGGSRYFITFIDDFSKWTTVYTMKRKSEALDLFKTFHRYAENHTENHIQSVNFIQGSHASSLKALRTDNGGEYISNDFKEYLRIHGILHQLTVAYTPQQNGVAERANRTLLDLVRSMLHARRIEKRFWAEGLSTAAYVRNRVPSRSLPLGVTPYKRWHDKVPDISHLRVFGCNCWYVPPKCTLHKLSERSIKGVLVGYSSESKGYKIWNSSSNTFIISRDVTFDERPIDIIQNTSSSQYQELPLTPEPDLSSCTDQAIDTPEDSRDLIEQEVGEEQQGCIEDSTIPTTPGTSLPRRSTRTPAPLTEWWKTDPGTSSDQALAVCAIPRSYKEATKLEHADFWKPGIDREHDCLLKNKTWTYIPRKPGMHVLPCKYVFRIKDSGPKARLVALGCLQKSGIDYDETFAPVVKMVTIRIILALVAHLDLECEQMDVVTAFLNGDLDQDIYMEIPDGLKTSNNAHMVCKLQKALYGLKQAPRQWYAKINTFLTEHLSFKSSPYDPCLYTLTEPGTILIIGLYVDDLLIAGNNSSKIKHIKNQLSKMFEMKDLGVTRTILGIEVRRDRSSKSLTISQSKYTDEILRKFGMESSNPTSTPMEKSWTGVSPTGEVPPSSNGTIPYREAIGCVMYLMTCTRPDLAFAIGKLAQFSETATDLHWSAVKRVLRYIGGTKHYGITYKGQDHNPIITGYSDSDFAGCVSSRKSTSGFIFMLAGGAVSWKSKKQTMVATSTCEAEYVAICLASKEAVWLSNLLGDLLSIPSSPISINVDNEGAIASAKSTGINQRNKHIDISYHYVRDSVLANRIALSSCSTTDQLADPLTKALERLRHEKLIAHQGLMPIR